MNTESRTCYYVAIFYTSESESESVPEVDFTQKMVQVNKREGK